MCERRGKIYKSVEQRGHLPLDVLTRRCQETLLPHVPYPKHARIALAVILLGLREGSFNCLFPPAVDSLAPMRFRKGIEPLQRVLPHMPLHHLSVHARPETLSSPWAPLAGLAFTAVLPVPLARRGLPGQTLFLRADVWDKRFIQIRGCGRAVIQQMFIFPARPCAP